MQRPRRWRAFKVLLAHALAAATAACAIIRLPSEPGWIVTRAERLEILRRAQVWQPTDVPNMNLRVGPSGAGAFAPDASVECAYVEADMRGHSPKFTCAISSEDRVKVKYGRENGEAYGEVAATRLLWALGFAADRMYPVTVICRHCPRRLGGRPLEDGLFEFDVASVERKLPGREISLRDRTGWTWSELDLIDETAGGATVAQRDALKLLAAMLQHSDSKSEQQRLLCADSTGHHSCEHPIAMINDLGLTFGAASLFNRGEVSSVNFQRWSAVHVWRPGPRCIANLPVSQTGTLDSPLISEEGRAFLAKLLLELSDRQLHDLFETARFHLRRRAPDTSSPELGRIDEWVAAFKQKRDEIVEKRCEVGRRA